MANDVATIQKDISDAVMTKINDMTSCGELSLPQEYNAGNALKSAMLKILDIKTKDGRKALEVCKKSSISNALLNMVVQGLSPERTQCYFIAYGDELQLQRSYFGTVAALKRAVPEVKKVVCELAHQDDVIRWAWTDKGERFAMSIDTDPLTNREKPLSAGFCNIYGKDGELLGSTVMTWSEIRTSWAQSRNYKPSDPKSVHNLFPEEMAKRTLISRACKLLLNSATSSWQSAVVDAFNATTSTEFKAKDEGPDEKRRTMTSPLSKAEAMKAKYVVQQDAQAQAETMEANEAQPNQDGDEYEPFDDAGLDF